MRSFLITALLLLSLSGLAQRRYLNGVIMGMDTQSTVEGVHITNTQASLLTSSNLYGVFKIPAQHGDTLTFTHVGMKRSNTL